MSNFSNILEFVIFFKFSSDFTTLSCCSAFFNCMFIKFNSSSTSCFRVTCACFTSARSTTFSNTGFNVVKSLEDDEEAFAFLFGFVFSTLLLLLILFFSFTFSLLALVLFFILFFALKISNFSLHSVTIL